MDAKDFAAAGLYDPSAPGAPERLELLGWLAGRGVPLERMVEAHRANVLTSVAGDEVLRPGPRRSVRDIAAELGLDVEYLMRLGLAVGIPPRSPDDRLYTEDDVRMFASSAMARPLFGDQAVLRFTRVVGSSLARIAEAAVTLFQVQVEGPMREAVATELDLARQSLRGVEALSSVEMLMQPLFRAHVETAIRRLREARPRLSVDTATLAVGFVDLVGFTTLSHRMSPRELAEVIERFEEAAYDIAASHDGRVVKLVGDEVMFVTRDPAAACEIGLTLVERFAADRSVTPRGGLAHGELLVRGGDYYGPIVNLAARVAQIAVPNELLVTGAVASASAGAYTFNPAGKRLLKGFDDPVALSTVERR